MKLCAEILYQILSKYASVSISGTMKNELSLSPPVFYDGHSKYQNNMIYLGRSGELLQPDQKVYCLIICIGGKLPACWDLHNSCLFTISSGLDILSVFNILQNAFTGFSAWKDDLQRILDTSADSEKMIERTAALQNRFIVLTDKNLQLLAATFPPDAMPLERVQQFAQNHKGNTIRHEPFFYQIEGRNVYCLNIFIKNEYAGIISVQADEPPMTDGDCLIYDLFVQYIEKALRQTIQNSQMKQNSIRSYLADLLNCYPVREANIHKALETHGLQNVRWICMALCPSKYMQNIPLNYLCILLEEYFESGFTVSQADCIALYYPVRDMEQRSFVRIPKLEEILEKIDLYAGISTAFDNIMQARDYYQQATAALETAKENGWQFRCTYFDEIALEYTLKNSIGKLRMELFIPRELLQLRDQSAYGADYWHTLKIFLENEMNASKTARDLYIHRSTLLKRLETIEQVLDLSTPVKRFYLRYCIYLYETLKEI